MVHLAVFHQGTNRIVEYHALAEGMNFQVFKDNIISRYVNAVVVLVIGTVNLRRIRWIRTSEDNGIVLCTVGTEPDEAAIAPRLVHELVILAVG